MKQQTSLRRQITLLVIAMLLPLVGTILLPSQPVKADTATLIPGAGTTTASGDGTDSGVITNGATACTGVVCANSIDETIASTDGDTSYNTNDQSETTGTQYYQLTDMASGYTSMNSVSIDVRCKEVGSGNDTLTLSAIIYASNETTILADNGSGGAVQLASFQGNNNCGSGAYATISAASLTVNGGNDTKANWDGARLALIWTYSQNQGKDDLQIYVTTAEIDIDYNAVATPTQVVFTTAARTVTAGTCSGGGSVITIQLQDGGGTPTNPSGATTIRITSDTGGTFTVYSDSSCASQLTNGDVSFSTAENTKSFYVIDTRKSNPTHQLTATKQTGPDTISSANQNITVNAGAVSRLVVTLPGQTFTDGTGNSGSPTNRTAGSSFTITSISATDDYFNVNTGYSGAQTLAYAGPSNAPDTTSPTYTTAVSFTSGQSTTTLTTTLFNAESTTITVTDGGSYGYASSSVTVDPGILQNYLVSATTPSIAGACVSSNSITARDDWNNTRSTDTSTVNMTSSGTSITFYTDGTCGSSTSQYTLSGGTSSFWFSSTLKQTGFTVTATEDLSTPTGTSGSLTIDPAAANAILVQLPGQGFTDGTGVTGSPSFTGTRTPNATAGTSFNVNLKAVDQYNNLVNTGSNNYTGSKTISWADSVAGNAPDTTTPSFPGSVTFSNGEANTQTITYYNAATLRTVEADDTGTPVSGTASSTFEVQADVIQNYGVAPAAASQTAGVAFNVTVTARDDWNNSLGALYSPPAGTYVWTTNAANAPDTTAPSIGTLAQGDFSSGVATKSVTLYAAENGVTFSAQEPSAGASGTSTTTVTNDVGEVSAHVDDSSVSGDASVQENIPLTVTVTLLDTWENPVSGVSSSNITLSATGSPTINQPGSNTDASGQTTGDLTWATAGAYTVSVQISTILLVQNDGTTADADGFLDDTHGVNVTTPIPEATFRGGTTIRGGTRIE